MTNYKEIQAELDAAIAYQALAESTEHPTRYRWKQIVLNLKRRLNTLTPPRRSLPLAEVTVNGRRVAARILKETINGSGKLTTVVLEDTGQRVSKTAEQLQLAHIRG